MPYIAIDAAAGRPRPFARMDAAAESHEVRALFLCAKKNAEYSVKCGINETHSAETSTMDSGGCWCWSWHLQLRTHDWL